MGNLVSAYVIYDMQQNQYINNGKLVTINCEQVTQFSPKRVWLQRWLAPGDGTVINYQPTMAVNSTDLAQYGTNLIQGFIVEQVGGGNVIVDVLDINTFLAGCNACCGNTAVTLARYYTGGIADFAYPVSAKFCITRLDDGSAFAHNQAALAYASQYVNSFRLRSNLSGTSTYEVTSYVGWSPIPRGSDTVTAGGCP